ncbi:hypothetical protein THAOC_24145 [Thalassiosira oceanica]|uniref:Uncharacterized protein n=1 Tax=Thalassiosira oceanica TaxID=159749 RepID=K0SBB0_THAOC|nr:hypothetical protein THAOC_24145 [Thalassiosira oceanica]|eukprot:EJK56037.1 hypothetical protein THAOC_24145 [Thalassiosira oceanica]
MDGDEFDNNLYHTPKDPDGEGAPPSCPTYASATPLSRLPSNTVTNAGSLLPTQPSVNEHSTSNAALPQPSSRPNGNSHLNDRQVASRGPHSRYSRVTIPGDSVVGTRCSSTTAPCLREQ